MNWNAFFLPLTLGIVGFGAAAQAVEPQKIASTLALPDAEIVTAYQRAATQNVLAAIKRGTRPLIDGPEGRRSVEIILAVYKSARTGKVVELPLKK